MGLPEVAPTTVTGEQFDYGTATAGYVSVGQRIEKPVVLPCTLPCSEISVLKADPTIFRSRPQPTPRSAPQRSAVRRIHASERVIFRKKAAEKLGWSRGLSMTEQGDLRPVKTAGPRQGIGFRLSDVGTLIASW